MYEISYSSPGTDPGPRRYVYASTESGLAIAVDRITRINMGHAIWVRDLGDYVPEKAGERPPPAHDRVTWVSPQPPGYIAEECHFTVGSLLQVSVRTQDEGRNVWIKGSPSGFRIRAETYKSVEEAKIAALPFARAIVESMLAEIDHLWGKDDQPIYSDPDDERRLEMPS